MKIHHFKNTLCAALTSVLAANGLVSCVSVEKAAPPVTVLTIKKPSETPVLARGRDIYLSACVKCHSVEPIRDHSATEWTDDILPTMCKKSKLASADADAVKAYVLAALGPLLPQT